MGRCDIVGISVERHRDVLNDNVGDLVAELTSGLAAGENGQTVEDDPIGTRPIPTEETSRDDAVLPRCRIRGRDVLHRKFDVGHLWKIVRQLGDEQGNERVDGAAAASIGRLARRGEDTAQTASMDVAFGVETA